MGKACLVISLKFTTLVTFLFGAGIIITCGWTLAAVLNHGNDDQYQDKEIEPTTKPSPVIQNRNTFSSNNNQNMHMLAKLELPSLNNFTETGTGDFELEFDTPKSDKKYLFPKFHKMEGNYRAIIIACLSVAMIVGFMQMISSMFTLSSCSKKIVHGLKVWLSLHILVFLVLLICFTVPLTYHPEKGEQVKLMELLPSVRARIDKFSGSGSMIQKLTHDLTGYYIVLGLNELLLFVTIIALCFCKCCSKDSYESFP